METKLFNVLIVEDHPMTLEMFVMFFKTVEDQRPDWKFNIKTGDCCESAIYALKNHAPVEGYDLIFLDYRMPPSSDGKYVSGEDVAVYIRERFPKSKILFITSSHDTVIKSVLKNINPEGFLIKAETTPEILLRAVIEILLGGSYYGKSAHKIMRLPFETDLILDEWDRKLLYELNRGTKTTHIPNILPLSLSSVARRKRRLKEIFEVEGDGDGELLARARELGFIG
ncbi:MAG: response regulator [Aequorivita sp.]